MCGTRKLKSLKMYHPPQLSNFHSLTSTPPPKCCMSSEFTYTCTCSFILSWTHFLLDVMSKLKQRESLPHLKHLKTPQKFSATRSYNSLFEKYVVLLKKYCVFWYMFMLQTVHFVINWWCVITLTIRIYLTKISHHWCRTICSTRYL